MGPISPYSKSLVMLQLLEQENHAEGSGRGRSQSILTLASPVTKKKGLSTPVKLAGIASMQGKRRTVFGLGKSFFSFLC